MAVTLIESMGNDLSIVNAARVSYGGESKELTDRDEGLLNYLMRERHGSPFEMVVFKFKIETPIAVAREWMRHRIGSFSEISTRYVELKNGAYVPPVANIRTQVGKPGHYTFEPMELGKALRVQAMFHYYNEQAQTAYKALLDMGVAKELARNVLPLGTYTEFIWTVNLRSALNFLSLRLAPNALVEIREQAQQVLWEVEKIVPVTMELWEEHGRPTP